MEKTYKSTKAVKKEKVVDKTLPVKSDNTRPSISKEKTTKQSIDKDNTFQSKKSNVKDSKTARVTTSKTSHFVRNGTKAADTKNKKDQSETKHISQKPYLSGRKQLSQNSTQNRGKPNAVLDTFQNVTVSSPPLTRKHSPKEKEHVCGSEELATSSKRTRTNTRTLQPEEVVVLRNESAKQRIEAEIEALNKTSLEKSVQDSIAFEIRFKTDCKSLFNTDLNVKNEDQMASDAEASYSDDFESYESDFESDTPSVSICSDETINDNVPKSIISGPQSHQVTNEAPDDDEESEPTQNPITVIHRDNYLERNLDSGQYDMNLRVQENSNDDSVLTNHQTFDSLDAFSGAASEQLDSGISSCRALVESVCNKNEKGSTVYGGFSLFLSKPFFTKRGAELMSKIKFDTLVFSLFEMRPVSYDTYMQTYGKINTTQSVAQTIENFSNSDSQTDDYGACVKWTQHPPKFDIETIQQQKVYMSSNNCCGQGLESDANDTTLFDSSFRRQTQICSPLYGKSINFSKLQAFLANTSNLILKVLSSTDVDRQAEKSQLITPNKVLNTNFLNALGVTHVFANSKFNIIITVLESLPEADVYRSDFSNLLMVWSASDCLKPTRLLSTWSKVCRVEICNDMQDIIVCGLSDGSVAMWDLRETHSFCSKLDGYLNHFAATQSVAPTWNEKTADGTGLDIGAVIDIRSFLSRQKLESFCPYYKPIQFASLNDFGIVVVWTLVEVAKRDGAANASYQSKDRTRFKSQSKENERIDYCSPWARVKLVQSAICDLRSYLERDLLSVNNNFNRAKFLFEKNIYSDEILRELKETPTLSKNNQLQGLRFSTIAAGHDSIYVCTNRNFILICSKSLKPNKFRKIFLDESRFLFPTALKILTNENFLAVGLSNGSVVILNCSQTDNFLKLKRSADNISLKVLPSTRVMKKCLDAEIETGKSCAIQNIILNERWAVDQGNRVDNTTLCQSIEKMAFLANKPFETRQLDQQVLFSGSMLRKDLVKSLSLSSDGCYLFILSDGEVRCYGLAKDEEIPLEEVVHNKTGNSKIIDMGIVQISTKQQYLVLLTNENIVKMFLLKK